MIYNGVNFSFTEEFQFKVCRDNSVAGIGQSRGSSEISAVKSRHSGEKSKSALHLTLPAKTFKS